MFVALPDIPPLEERNEYWRGIIGLRYGSDVVDTLCAVFIEEGKISPRIWDCNAGTWDSVKKKASGKWLSPMTGHMNAIVDTCLLEVFKRIGKVR